MLGQIDAAIALYTQTVRTARRRATEVALADLRELQASRYPLRGESQILSLLEQALR